MKRRFSPTRALAVFSSLTMIALLIYVFSPIGRLRLALGGRTLALLKLADHTDVYRIDPDWVQDPHGPVIGQSRLASNGMDFKGFEIEGIGRALDRAATMRLAAVLDDAHLYHDSGKSCEFGPAFACRMRAGDMSLELLLDFTCDRLQLLTRDAHGQTVHVTFGDVDSARPALIALIRQAFPNDPRLPVR